MIVTSARINSKTLQIARLYDYAVGVADICVHTSRGQLDFSGHRYELLYVCDGNETGVDFLVQS